MIAIDAPRLRLRPFEPADLMPLHGMLTDPNVTWFMPELAMADLDATRAFLRRAMESCASPVSLHMILAVAERDGAAVGGVCLNFTDGLPGNAHWSLGYFIRAGRWGRGYATEAVGAALNWLFRHGAYRVSASALAENLASRRVLEKNGFIQEGLLVRSRWHDGQWRDCAVYRLLREEHAED